MNYDSENQMFESGGFESFGDNGFESGMMPPVQTTAYTGSQKESSKVVPIVLGVLAALLIVVGVVYSIMKPYLTLYKQSKRTLDDTYTMTATMNFSGAGTEALAGSGADGMKIQCVKGNQIMSMDISSSIGGMMIIYTDLQDPSNMVIDIKPLFKTIGKNLGEYGISFDTMAKSSDSMAFSAKQLTDVLGKNVLDVDQLQDMNSELALGAELKTLRDYFEYDKKVDAQYKVLGDHAYYFKLKPEALGAEYKNTVSYLAVDGKHKVAAVASVGGVTTSFISDYAFGDVPEPVMPDVSKNEQILNYLKMMFQQ